MARVHPQAMAPHRPGSTRTAPPFAPDGWYAQPRMLLYLLFGATGLLYLLVALVALRVVWALGAGQARYQEVMAQLEHPLYVAFHALCLAAVVFVAVRFFRLFPKAQPPRIGPAKPPPRPLIALGLYAAWLGVTAGMVAVLGGWLF